jgi:hypothetical protein
VFVHFCCCFFSYLDAYWCLSRFLDGIQNNYTFAQPGIQRMVHKLSELIHRVDSKEKKNK